MADLTFLEKFTKGDKNKMKRYINMYLSIAPQTFNMMQQNIAEQDWNQLRINAHSLKPQADYMGIQELKSLLIDIEDDVKFGKVQSLAAHYEKARDIHSQSEKTLKAYLEET